MATAFRFYTSEQAAQRLGVTQARVRQLCPHYVPMSQKHGNNWLLTDADIERLASRHDGRKKLAECT